MFNHLTNLVKKEIDESQLESDIKSIIQTDKWSDYRYYNKTANYVYTRLRQIGLTSVKKIPIASDGKTKYGDWILPEGWVVNSASLKIIYPFSKEITNYYNNPTCLFMYSKKNNLSNSIGRIIIIDNLSDIDKYNTSKCFILTSLHPNKLLKKAISERAIGILCDYLPDYFGVRSKNENPNMNRWENDFLCPRNQTSLYGFSLNTKVANLLRDNPNILLKAEVNTQNACIENYSVTGLIKGKCSDKSILIYSHLYEPGANDNASGASGLLSIASVFMKLIENNIIERPDYDIKFVFGFECISMMHLYEKTNIFDNVFCGINLDMIGGNDNEKSKLSIWHNPLTTWSYYDSLIVWIIEKYLNSTNQKFEYIEKKYDIADNLIADPQLGKIPMISLMMHPAKSYHTSEDTIDKISYLVLKRNITIVFLFIFYSFAYLNNPSNKQLSLFKWHKNKFSTKYTKSRFLLLSDLVEKNDYLNKPYIQNIDRILSTHLKESHKNCILIRKVKGCLTFKSITEIKRLKIPWQPFYNYSLNCLLFWCDGQRTLKEALILSFIELELDSIETYYSFISPYIDFLNNHNYILLMKGELS